MFKVMSGYNKLTGTIPRFKWVPTHGVLRINGGAHEGATMGWVTENEGFAGTFREEGKMRKARPRANPFMSKGEGREPTALEATTYEGLVDYLTEFTTDRSMAVRTANAMQRGTGDNPGNIIEYLSRGDFDRANEAAVGLQDRILDQAPDITLSDWEDWRFARGEGTQPQGERFQWLDIGSTLFSDPEIQFYSEMFKQQDLYALTGTNCQQHVYEARDLYGGHLMPKWMKELDPISNHWKRSPCG